jgi:sugar phosphate isomerase/epimerase
MLTTNRLSISSWSLHRCLGPLRWTTWDERSQTQTTVLQDQPTELELVELPGAAAARGLSFLELCHFHFPSRDDAYLARLRQSFEAAGIRFHTLLVDYGDISSPDPVRRESDIRYLKGWIDTAKTAGASAVRIVAGEQPAGDRDAIARSFRALRELREYAAGSGVELVTENFRELTATVASWSQVVESVGGSFKTIVDFGNFAAGEKEEGVRCGAPLAHSIHAKPDCMPDGRMDVERFQRLFTILAETGSEAPISIIFDGEGSMWDGIERIKRLIVEFGCEERMEDNR